MLSKKITNELPTKFCVAPFLQITTHPSRSFSPCPYLGGTTWAKNYSSIMESWNSSELEELRQNFLSNKQSSICNRCWNEESHGKRSLRLRLLDPVTLESDYKILQDFAVVESVIESIKNKSYQTGPKLLSIKNGNVCNAKCRTCHPGDSSRWVPDAKKVFELTQQTPYRIDGNEINWSDQQIDEIFLLSKNLTRLELFGGEPTYNKKVIGLLNRIVESGHSKHISLYINTNGSVNIVDKIPDLHCFKEIDIGVSIDGLDQQFEYIRHGIKYSELVHNIKDWQKYFKKHNIVSNITAITTVSILNVYYLPEIKKAIVDLLGIEPFWNLLIDPDFLSIKTLPQNVKKIVIEKLQYDNSFDELINLLNQPTLPRSWRQFLELTEALDTIRKENFSKTFLEFYNIIQQHGLSGPDLDQTDFDKIVVFIGDCEHPQGWYLKEHAKKYDNTAKKITSTNCNQLKPGIYYTSLPDLSSKENLVSVFEQADKIIYCEPSCWQGLTRWHRIFKIQKKDKRIIKQALKKIMHKKIVEIIE